MPPPARGKETEMERIRLKLINSAGQTLQTCPALTRIEAWGTEAAPPARQ